MGLKYYVLKVIQIHVSPTTSGGPFMYAMVEFNVKYSCTYLNTGVIIY